MSRCVCIDGPRSQQLLTGWYVEEMLLWDEERLLRALMGTVCVLHGCACTHVNLRPVLKNVFLTAASALFHSKCRSVYVVSAPACVASVPRPPPCSWSVCVCVEVSYEIRHGSCCSSTTPCLSSALAAAGQVKPGPRVSQVL